MRNHLKISAAIAATCIACVSALSLRTDIDSYIEQHACSFAKQMVLPANTQDLSHSTSLSLDGGITVDLGTISTGYSKVTANCEVVEGGSKVNFALSGTASLVDSRFQQSAEQPVKDLPTLHIPYTMHVTADVCLEAGYATGVKNIKFTKSPAERVEMAAAKWSTDDGPATYPPHLLEWGEKRLTTYLKEVYEVIIFPHFATGSDTYGKCYNDLISTTV